MKKLAIGLLFVAGIAGAACMGPYCYDDTGATIGGKGFNGNGLQLPVVSSTTVATITPAIGQVIVCNTCANANDGKYAVCVATNTNSSAWVLTSSTTVSCK